MCVSVDQGCQLCLPWLMNWTNVSPRGTSRILGSVRCHRDGRQEILGDATLLGKLTNTVIPNQTSTKAFQDSREE